MSARGKRRRSVTTKDSEQLWRKFLRQPPQITSEQVERMERNFIDQMEKIGPIRRAALASLNRSGRELAQAFGRKATRTDAEAGAALVASIESMRKFLLAVADCLNTAEWRLKVAMLSREDMQEVLASAKAENEQPAVH